MTLSPTTAQHFLIAVRSLGLAKDRLDRVSCTLDCRQRSSHNGERLVPLAEANGINPVVGLNVLQEV
jgi:hypothetical protein